MKKKLWFILALIILSTNLINPNTLLSGVKSAIEDLCESLACILPIAAMLMVIFAGVIYASGQMMGAETRARANVWATAALTGALIAILIATVAPAVLGYIYNPTSGLVSTNTNVCKCRQ